MPFVRKCSHRRKASTTTVSLGVMFCIMVFAMFFLEILRIYDTQYAIEVRAQRAVNMTVEAAMDDLARADGYNIMLNYNKQIPKTGKTVQATLEENLRVCLNLTDPSGRYCKDSSGNVLYKCEFSTSPGYTTYVTGDKTRHDIAAGIKIPIKTTIRTNFGSFFNNYFFDWVFTNTYESTNYRVDDNQRAGWIVG